MRGHTADNAHGGQRSREHGLLRAMATKIAAAHPVHHHHHTPTHNTNRRRTPPTYLHGNQTTNTPYVCKDGTTLGTLHRLGQHTMLAPIV